MPPGCPVFNVWLKACNPQPNVRCPSLFLGGPLFRQLFSNREQTSTCLFMLSHNNLSWLKFQEKLTWEKLAKLQNAGPLTHIFKRAGSFAHCRAKRATTYIQPTLNAQIIHFSFFLSTAEPNEPPHIYTQHLALK